MKLPRNSAKYADIDIKDYYGIKVASIWAGLKSESPAFWWLCIYMIFEYIRPQSIYQVIDILPWGQIALIMACITAFTDRNIKYVKSSTNTLLILFTIIVLLSCIFAFQPSTAFDKIDIPINWLILYFLIITTLNTEKKYFIFILLFLLVNFKMSQHGFITYASRGFGYARWGLAGAPGWFQNAGDFGIQMVIFTPLATTFILALRSYWGRYKCLLFYLFPFTGLIVLIGTASRGAQLGVMAIGFWFLMKSRNGIKAMAGILIIGWALFSILPEKMLDEYTTAGEDSTSENRLVLWSYGLEVVGDYPVLGIGLENFLGYCWFMNPVIVEGATACQETHNTYIEALTEVGVTGFLVYILILISMLVINARTRANAESLDNKFIWYISHGLDGGLIGYMISSVFISVLFYPMVWVQLAMITSLYTISKKQLIDAEIRLKKAKV